jgi:hypothetical protein
MALRPHLKTSTATAAFAHLLGLKPSAKPAVAEEDKPDEPKEDAAAVTADTETDDDEDVEDEDGHDDDDKKDGKKGKKAKKPAASDDEECAEEEDDDEAVANAAKAGRTFERARCSAIFASPAAGVRPDIAAHLAFKTDMSAKAAVDLLTTTAQGHQAAPARERAARPRVELGDGGAQAAPSAPAGIAAQIVAAGKKRRGEK